MNKPPDAVPNGSSRGSWGNLEGRDLNSNSSSSGDFAIFDETFLVEDQFYNFGNLGNGDSCDSLVGVFDPSNPDSIPFSDIPVPGQGFDPDLFNSILSTGDDILAKLDSGQMNSVGVLDATGGEGGSSDSTTSTNRVQVSGTYVCMYVCLCVMFEP